MGVHDEYTDVIWLPRSLYPKRSAAIRWLMDWNVCAFTEVRCLSRWMRYTPQQEDDEGITELWTECYPYEPGAFRVWRLEKRMSAWSDVLALECTTPRHGAKPVADLLAGEFVLREALDEDEASAAMHLLYGDEDVIAF